MKKTYALIGMIFVLGYSTMVQAQLDVFNKRPDDAGWWQSTALGNAANIQRANRQSEVYARIGLVLAQAGKSEDAAAAFTKARESADFIAKTEDKVAAFAYLALAQARAGDQAGSAKTLEAATMQMVTLSDAFLRIRMLAEFAEAFHVVGDKDNYEKWIKQALAETNAIQRLRDRSPQKLMIVQTMLRLGEIESAEALIKDIWYIEQRAAAYVALASKLISLSKFDEAKAILAKLDYREDKISAYLAMATAYKAKDQETEALEQAAKALEVASTYLDDDVRARQMIRIAETLAGTGLKEPILQALSGARDASEAFGKASFKAWAFPKIAMVFGQVDESGSAASTLSDAETEAQNITNNMAKAWALARIAHARAAYDRDNLEGTVDAAKSVLEDTSAYPAFNAILLSYLASAQARAGETDAFRSTMVEADGQRKRIADNVEYGTAGVSVHATQTELESAIAEQAKTLAENQQLDEALTVTSYLLFNPRIKQDAYIALARQEARSGAEGRKRLATWLDIRFERADGRALGALEVVKEMLLK